MLVTLIVLSPLFGAGEKKVGPGFLRFVAGLLLGVFVDGGVRCEGRISEFVSCTVVLDPLRISS